MLESSINSDNDVSESATQLFESIEKSNPLPLSPQQLIVQLSPQNTSTPKAEHTKPSRSLQNPPHLRKALCGRIDLSRPLQIEALKNYDWSMLEAVAIEMLGPVTNSNMPDLVIDSEPALRYVNKYRPEQLMSMPMRNPMHMDVSMTSRVLMERPMATSVLDKHTLDQRILAEMMRQQQSMFSAIYRLCDWHLQQHQQQMMERLNQQKLQHDLEQAALEQQMATLEDQIDTIVQRHQAVMQQQQQISSAAEIVDWQEQQQPRVIQSNRQQQHQQHQQQQQLLIISQIVNQQLQQKQEIKMQPQMSAMAEAERMHQYHVFVQQQHHQLHPQ